MNSDWIEIYSPDVNGRLIGRWYGNNPPQNLTSLPGAWIKFRSDNEITGQGFRMNWNNRKQLSITYGFLLHFFFRKIIFT